MKHFSGPQFMLCKANPFSDAELFLGSLFPVGFGVLFHIYEVRYLYVLVYIRKKYADDFTKKGQISA